MLNKKVCYHCRKIHKSRYDVIWGKEIDGFWRTVKKIKCPGKKFFWAFESDTPPWCPYKLEHAVTRKRC